MVALVVLVSYGGEISVASRQGFAEEGGRRKTMVDFVYLLTDWRCVRDEGMDGGACDQG